LKPHTAYPISVIRQGDIHDFRIEVGKRPTQDQKIQPSNKK